jgi:hypothetical protein
MSPDEIKTDHRSSMTPIKGRRTIARVTKLFRITAMAAYEEIGGTLFHDEVECPPQGQNRTHALQQKGPSPDSVMQVLDIAVNRPATSAGFS